MADTNRCLQAAKLTATRSPAYRAPTRTPVTWQRLPRSSRERLVSSSGPPLATPPDSRLLQSPKSELQTKRPSPTARIRHTHPSSPSPRLPAAAPPLLSEFRLPPPRGACFRIRLVRRSSRGLLDPDPDPARPPVQGTLDPSPCPPLKSYHAMRTPSSCTLTPPIWSCDLHEGSRDMLQ